MKVLFPTASEIITLRDYQREAIDATYEYLSERPGHPLIEIPTGGGKTPIIATLAKDVADAGGRVLILAHVKELLEQAADKLSRMGDGLDVGVYSAGLGRKELGNAVTVAGVQSICRVADQLPAFDLAIVDEAHLIPPDGEGMYRTVLDAVLTKDPEARVIGLTATPFRTKEGDLTGPGHLFDDVSYRIGVKTLIDAGYLSPLRTKATLHSVSLDGIRKQAGEFVGADAERAMLADDLFGVSIAEIIDRTADRNSVLIFAAGVDHCRHVCGAMLKAYQDCEMVTGDTHPDHRAATIERFKAGDVKYLANVNVLTTGFDAPNVDCVVLLRPTMSPGLYYQMVGRGFRIAEGKADCLVLDYGRNIERHGPVDHLVGRIVDPSKRRGDNTGPLVRTCGECGEMFDIEESVCPDCGAEYASDEDKDKRAGPDLDEAPSELDIIARDTKKWRDVTWVDYSAHTKKGASPDHPRTLKVTYEYGAGQFISEWVCIEHAPGFARDKAEGWWAKRCDEPMPSDVDVAVKTAETGVLMAPSRIHIEKKASKQYPEIIGYEFGDDPPKAAPYPIDIPDDEIPF